MIITIILNILVVFLELAGLNISISDRKWLVFAFYTQIANILACLSSLAFVLNSDTGWVTVLCFTSSCMLTMTFLVTAFVLVPMGGGFRRLMCSGNGLYHHTLCHAISVLRYIFLEHTSALPCGLRFRRLSLWYMDSSCLL